MPTTTERGKKESPALIESESKTCRPSKGMPEGLVAYEPVQSSSLPVHTPIAEQPGHTPVPERPVHSYFLERPVHSYFLLDRTGSMAGLMQRKRSRQTMRPLARARDSSWAWAPPRKPLRGARGEATAASSASLKVESTGTRGRQLCGSERQSTLRRAEIDEAVGGL